MDLSVKKERQPMAPKEPTGRSRNLTASPCAASSMTASLCRSAIAMTASMSAACPYRCTGRLAFVRGVIARSTAAAPHPLHCDDQAAGAVGHRQGVPGAVKLRQPAFELPRLRPLGDPVGADHLRQLRQFLLAQPRLVVGDPFVLDPLLVLVVGGHRLLGDAGPSSCSTNGPGGGRPPPGVLRMPPSSGSRRPRAYSN